MALVHSVLIFAALCGFSAALASLGGILLRWMRVEIESDAEHLLVSLGIALIALQILLFLVQFTTRIRQGCFALLALLCFTVMVEARLTSRRFLRVMHQMAPGGRFSLRLFVLLPVVVLVEFLMTVAPLTGSDALHYHFTTQRLILEQGFHPIFSIAESFLCGQSHLLILFGLALGSEKFAMGTIFLGGLLTSFALACLAARCAPRGLVEAITLLFLLTPVIFWQISTSGAPDIWMAFFAALAIVVLNQGKAAGRWKQAMLGGFLAGGIAGAKYTGCILATALVLVFVLEIRSALGTLLFLGGALISGAWPYLRNWVWTGDPFFPFYSKVFSLRVVNEYALANLTAAAGISGSRHLAELLPFLFFSGIQENGPGFYDFFSPLLLALAPLILLAFRNTREWRVHFFVWLLFASCVFVSSSLPRFLIPVFPLALSCAATAIAYSEQRGWGAVSKLATGSIALVSLVDAVGLALYSRAPLRAALGMQDGVSYLAERAPDYQIAGAILQGLSGAPRGRKTLVFFRHLYYLDIPFVNGDPGSSWIVDPERLLTPEQWKSFLGQNGICYVVRSPNYPGAIAAALLQMENNGELLPVSKTMVQSFQGNRIEEDRVDVPVVILKLAQAPSCRDAETHGTEMP